MPVSIAPVDRQPGTVAGQFRFEARDQSTVLIVDRALAAEMIIVLGHFEHALARNIAAAQNVFEKRDDIVRLLRSSERENQYRVVIVLSGHSPTIVGRTPQVTASDSPERRDCTRPGRLSVRRRLRRLQWYQSSRPVRSDPLAERRAGPERGLHNKAG